MKKLFALLLAVMLVASMATVASAANTTTLTTTVPAASYTLNIPADQEIPFGAYRTEIGKLSVTNATGFATGKNLNVSIVYGAFRCEDVTTTIPFKVISNHAQLGKGEYQDIASGDVVTFDGSENGGVYPYFDVNTYSQDTLHIEVSSSNWGKALAGDYTATITFTAEVVVE